eukprot:6869188-Prymnesium_polylepis.1
MAVEAPREVWCLSGACLYVPPVLAMLTVLPIVLAICWPRPTFCLLLYMHRAFNTAPCGLYGPAASPDPMDPSLHALPRKIAIQIAI